MCSTLIIAASLDMSDAALQARAMSADVSAPREELQREAVFLAEIIGSHRASCEALYELMTQAEERGDREGFRMLDAAYDTMRDDSRAYWAWSRMTDIKRRLGTGHSAQLELGIR